MLCQLRAPMLALLLMQYSHLSLAGIIGEVKGAPGTGKTEAANQIISLSVEVATDKVLVVAAQNATTANTVLAWLNSMDPNASTTGAITRVPSINAQSNQTNTGVDTTAPKAMGKVIIVVTLGTLLNEWAKAHSVLVKLDPRIVYADEMQMEPGTPEFVIAFIATINAYLAKMGDKDQVDGGRPHPFHRTAAEHKERLAGKRGEGHNPFAPHEELLTAAGSWPG